MHRVTASLKQLKIKLKIIIMTLLYSLNFGVMVLQQNASYQLFAKFLLYIISFWIYRRSSTLLYLSSSERLFSNQTTLLLAIRLGASSLSVYCKMKSIVCE